MSEQRSLAGCGALILLGVAALLFLAVILASSSKTLIVFVLGIACIGAMMIWSTIMITSAIDSQSKKPDRP
ncbi:hypothetical protein [Streptosporangium amethystogenes]|uniref:hypothetical protein n=1 Tax=Streptosporangium amethystogenes TaxID=2002 RepID=UPI0004C9D56F|nr:hypothetical protein [Streptosporangium amethystogenes]